MYEKYKGLELGWYYGNNEENLRVYLAEYIRKISEYLHVTYELKVLNKKNNPFVWIYGIFKLQHLRKI